MNEILNNIGSLRCRACDSELDSFDDVFCQECIESYNSSNIIIDIDEETEEILYDL